MPTLSPSGGAIIPSNSSVYDPKSGATASPATTPTYTNPNAALQTPGKMSAPPPPTTTPPAPPKPITAISSDNVNQTITDNTQKLQTLKNTGLTVGPDNLARYSDSSFATAPSDAVQNENGTWTSGGVNYALGPSTTVDPEMKAITDQIAQMKTQFDTTSRAQIDNIKLQFDNLIKEQTDINTRSQASLDQSLLMGGSSRYAQESSNGQHTAIMSYGLQQLSDLNQKEQAAVIEAQQAMDAGDMKLMDQSLTIAQKARDEKQAAAKDLSDKLTTQNDKIRQQQIQSSRDTAIGGLLAQGITDPTQLLDYLNKDNSGASTGGDFTAKEVSDAIANLSPDAKNVFDIQKTAAAAGAPTSVLAAIGASRTVNDAFKAAGDFMSNATGDLGMYNQYKRDATAAGQTPSSFQTWQSTNEYNKAYAQAKGTAQGKAAGGGDNPTSPADYSMLSSAAQGALKTTGFLAYSPSTQSLASQLVNGQLAPAELSKRTTGSSSYNDILSAADKYAMATTGKHFNIAQADRDYKFANNKATQDTLNFLGSLVGSDDGSGNLAGGNLDQLIELSNNRLVKPSGIPGAGFGGSGQGLPPLNALSQWAQLEAGNPQIAQYHTTLLEVSDQVGKVLQGGGSGAGTSDAKLRQAQELFQKGFTPDQIKAVASSLKGLLANRAVSMVKDNAYLSDYADQFGITKGADGHPTTNSQLMQQESDAEKKLEKFDNQSPDNQALIDELKKQFPDMTAQEMSKRLGI